ncbi:pilus assembly PilX family protein [Rheinheimera sp. NSM]|uniref:pilus assembly PilX family protein n=1 Tax=Rheinheimera sp. NSM TaxID=3457884 RepID=UPI004035817F
MKKPTKQAGFVLVVAMIMLIAVTGVAVALLVSSGVDNKMMSSAQEAEIAINEAKGAHDEAYSREEFQMGGRNQFSLDIPVGTTLPAKETRANTVGGITAYSTIPTPTNCPNSDTGSSKAIACTFNRVVTTTTFGEVGQTIQVQSVVAQRVLN